MATITRENIGLLNDKGGYVYLVDQECKIRWAGSAIAEPKEKESLVVGMGIFGLWKTGRLGPVGVRG